MNGKDRRTRRKTLRRNLVDHLRLSANAELPEAHDRRFARAMIFTMSAVLAGFLIWAANTPVVEIATGDGVIRTKADGERVEHVDGGRIRRIDVSEGQRVKRGDRLVAFETDTLAREVQKLDALLVALEAERDRLQYVLDGRPAEWAARSAEPQETAALLFWTEQAFLDAELEVMAFERTALEASVSALELQRQTLQSEVDLIRDQLVRSRDALAKGAIPRNQVERLEREALQAERGVMSLAAEIVSRRTEITRSQLHEKELVAGRRRDAAQRLAELERRRADARLSREDLVERIARADVRATVGGTVMSLSASNPNEVIGAGELIAEIITDDSPLIAEVEISADLIGSIMPGMEARVKVLTFDFTRFCQMIGEVFGVSPSSFQNERGETVYLVTITLPGGQAEFGPGLDVLAPGLTVTVDVLSDTRMALSYLLKPLRLLRDRAFTEA